MSEDNDLVSESFPKPIKEGRIVFSGIQEGDEKEYRRILFTPPLGVEYSIWKKIDETTGKECYPEPPPVMAYATFDFGMEALVPLDLQHNVLVDGYNGLNTDSGLEDILMGTLMYDLFHAFFHIAEDPNYTHYHWALKGWLRNRVRLVEEDGS